MNNSKFAVDHNLEVDRTLDKAPWLRMQETELIEIISAIEAIKGSNYWVTLKDKVFDGVLESLNRRISDEKDEKEIFRLQGQIVWAQKYCDFDKLAEAYRNQLIIIRKQLTQ